MKLTEEGKQARRIYMKEYMKKWRKKNREKLQKYQADYWNRKAQELKG